MKNHQTTNKELDIIYSYIDYLLKQGQFDLIDHILSGAIFYIKSSYFTKENLTKDEILAYLTCCLPAQSELNSYQYFFNNVKFLFTKGELVGLEPKE